MAAPLYDGHLDWLIEQIEAAKTVIHSYRCIHCQIATAQTPVILVENMPQGAHVIIVGICHTCAPAYEGT